MNSQLQRLLKNIPKSELKARGFKAHMDSRPAGEPRHRWARVWCAAQGFIVVRADETASMTRKIAKIPRLVKRQTPAKDVNADAFLTSYEWRALRMRVLKRFGARCQCCGATPADGVRMHVDHIKPRRLHPELALEESNLQVLCEVCNHGKGNWDDTDWRPEPDPVPPAADAWMECGQTSWRPKPVKLPPDWNAPMWMKKPN